MQSHLLISCDRSKVKACNNRIGERKVIGLMEE